MPASAARPARESCGHRAPAGVCAATAGLALAQPLHSSAAMGTHAGEGLEARGRSEARRDGWCVVAIALLLAALVLSVAFLH
jgi:hypothetical protein